MRSLSLTDARNYVRFPEWIPRIDLEEFWLQHGGWVRKSESAGREVSKGAGNHWEVMS